MNYNSKKLAVEFKNVFFEYLDNSLVLKNVSFKIYESEYVCIIGHNGSGKSTISKILTGLLQPKSGKIYIFNCVIDESNVKNFRDNVGIVFQNPDNQFIGLTAEDDIAFGLENKKVDPEKMQSIINRVAKVVSIKNLLKLESNKLSGGQKQRVAIASVLAMDPKIIIFDESTSMLDPKAKQQLKDLMIILKNKYKKTVISITHDMEEVVKADRVIVMDGGKVIANGEPNKIFNNQKFLQKINLDIPFTLKLSNILSLKNKDINPTLNYETLIENIWKITK